MPSARLIARAASLTLCLMLVSTPAAYVPAAAQEVYPRSDSITINREGRYIDMRPIKTVRAPDGREAVADRIVVGYDAHASSAEIDAIHAAARRFGVQNAEAVRDVTPTEQLVDITGKSMADALAIYRAQPRVRYAVPDYMYHLAEVPNDPLFNSQWGMTQIQAPSAWDVTHGSASILVAVVDSGIYDEASTFIAPDGGHGHPDLRGKVAVDVNFTTERDSDDYQGHGTHVAGIAAADTNNSIGVAGAGYLTRLLNVKVVDATGGAPSSLVQTGIRWAADHGANVINLSLGAAGACDPGDQDALNYAWARNAVIVVAAGNDGTSNVQTPASCQHALAVASTDSNNTKSSFSTFGTWVQIAAPGGFDGSGNGILSTSYTGNYVYKSGTSMSTPHVAGIAALVWATGYGTSNQAVVNRLLATADPISGTGSFWQYGRLNAYAAVAQPACAPRPPVTVTITPNGSGHLQVSVATSGFDNFLQTVQFGNPSTTPSVPTNALIDIGSQTGQSGAFTASMPLGARQSTFTVRRANPGASTTVPIIATDSCGAWPTLVGGGPTAF